MPTYVYACKNCGHRFEQYQSFTDSTLTTCPECTQDTLRKVFDSVGIVFKGSGFYSTDSAKSETSSVASGSGSATSATSETSGTSESSSTSSTSSDSAKGSSSKDSAASASQPAAASAAAS